MNLYKISPLQLQPMKRIYFLMTPLLLIGISCSSPSPVEPFEWLIGTWENPRPSGSIYESWEPLSETELKGKSYFIKENDTITLENMRIRVEENKILFVPTVPNQNEGEEVVFAMKEYSDQGFTVENLAHDFPQVIHYQVMSPDSLRASIKGNVNGKEEIRYFPMRKIKGK